MSISVNAMAAGITAAMASNLLHAVKTGSASEVARNLDDSAPARWQAQSLSAAVPQKERELHFPASPLSQGHFCHDGHKLNQNLSWSILCQHTSSSIQVSCQMCRIKALHDIGSASALARTLQDEEDPGSIHVQAGQAPRLRGQGSAQILSQLFTVVPIHSCASANKSSFKHELRPGYKVGQHAQ